MSKNPFAASPGKCPSVVTGGVLGGTLAGIMGGATKGLLISGTFCGLDVGLITAVGAIIGSLVGATSGADCEEQSDQLKLLASNLICLVENVKTVEIYMRKVYGIPKVDGNQ